MILRLGVHSLHLLQHHLGRAVPHLPAGDMAVFNGHDGVIRVLAKVVDHHLAVAAKLGRDALGHLFKQIQLSRFQLYHPSSGFPFSLYLYLYHIILSIEINDYF